MDMPGTIRQRMGDASHSARPQMGRRGTAKVEENVCAFGYAYSTRLSPTLRNQARSSCTLIWSLW